MTTKHQPARPLPWQVHDDTYVLAHNGSSVLAGECWNQIDAVYLVHAANAYPKLVDTLRLAQDTIEALDGDQDENIGGCPIKRLLRELGEDQ